MLSDFESYAHRSRSAKLKSRCALRKDDGAVSIYDDSSLNVGFDQGRNERLRVAQTASRRTDRVYRVDARRSPEAFKVYRAESDFLTLRACQSPQSLSS